MEYVDNCQRISYRDAHFILLTYADATYGWRTDTFTGWGDWEAHPGRSVDNFWTGNPLYLDLEPGESSEGEIPWLAIAAGVGVISRVPLKRGLLSGRFDEHATFVEGDRRRNILPLTACLPWWLG